MGVLYCNPFLQCFLLCEDYEHLSPCLDRSAVLLHTAVSDNRVSRMVGYRSTPPPRGLSNRLLFIYDPTAYVVPVLSEDTCPAELVFYETLVQNPPYYYEHTPTHPISISLPYGLPVQTLHSLLSATRPQSRSGVHCKFFWVLPRLSSYLPQRSECLPKTPHCCSYVFHFTLRRERLCTRQVWVNRQKFHKQRNSATTVAQGGARAFSCRLFHVHEPP